MIKSLMEKVEIHRKEKCRRLEQEKLLSLILAAKNELKVISSGFNEAHDHDLTEFYIYQKRAAELKYKHLLKLYRENQFEEFLLAQPEMSQSRMVH